MGVMATPCEIKLIKGTLGELKKLTDPWFSSSSAITLGRKGYAQLFQQHAESILSLLEPYGEANEVRLLQEEYKRVSRQVQVFDKLPEPVFPPILDLGKDEEGYYELQASVKESINGFRYHSTDLVSKIEKGKLKPGKLDEIDKKIIALYQEAEKQNQKLPGSRKIARALYKFGSTQKEYSHTAINNRRKKLRDMGLIGHPDDNKDKAKRYTPKHINDIDTNSQVKRVF